MGFFTKLKKIFSGKEEESVSSEEEKKEAEVQEGEGRSSSQDEEAESSGQEKNEALVQQSAGREGESSSGKSEEPSCHGGSADRDESGEGYAAHGMPEEAAPSAQQISESGQWNKSTGTGKFQEWLIDSDSSKYYTGTDKNNHDPAWHEFRCIHQNLG